ncbi:RHS repeat-associated core domain-containing protein [Kouleothrix sp.]|uniref:RHS repeat protein n=1 Tax=Kouleothrix sp. TaxID=2779161 RepID=UPI0039197712
MTSHPCRRARGRVGPGSPTSSGTLQLKSGSTTLGTSAALSANTLYRIGIHQKKGTGADGVLEAFLAVGDAAFGAAFASSASQTFTSQASKLVVGATNSNAVDATFDDIRLDSAAMPGPSGGGSPTATPTNTPAGPTATPTNTPAGPTATPTTTPTGPSAPAAYDQSMTYDALGNLLSKTGVGSYAYGANGNGTGAGPHQARTVGGSTYSYDANGNLVSGGGRTTWRRADNLPLSVTRAGVTESYTYDGDGTRVAKTVGGVTTVYFAGLWEQIVGGASTQYYTFNGQVVALRDSAAGVSYLYGDQLGSVSFATSASGSATSRQDFDAWGAVRSGGINATSLNYTGQRLDSSGLLDYHARLYDPTLARFVSADSVVPSSASGGLDGVQLKGLTADFHEPGFAAQIGGENTLGFWFELSDQQRQQAGVPWGPANPQALNRYSYVLNAPVKATDPRGHNSNKITIKPGETDAYTDTLSKHKLKWDLIYGGAAIVAGLAFAPCPVCSAAAAGGLLGIGYYVNQSFILANEAIDRASVFATDNGTVSIEVDPLKRRVTIIGTRPDGSTYSVIIDNAPAELMESIQQTNKEHSEFMSHTSG